MTSPIPAKANSDNKTLSFSEALKAVADFKTITKQEWADDQYYGLLHNGFLMLHKPDGKFYQWIVSDGDLLGEDWVVQEHVGSMVGVH